MVTVKHAFNEGSRPKVLPVDHMEEDQQIRQQTKGDRGNYGPHNGKHADGANVAEKLPLLQGEARHEHNRRQQPVEECCRREVQRPGQACTATVAFVGGSSAIAGLRAE